jgi:phosphohistidine phosphatase
VKLYFLRHERAQERQEWTGDDVDRPLTDEGKLRIQRNAAAIVKFVTSDIILTSPLTRARQTAEILATALHIEDILVEDGRLSPGFNKRVLAGILADYPGYRSILLVGHEPDFSATIRALIGGGRLVCKKGALACVRINATSSVSLTGELLWLLPPKLMAKANGLERDDDRKKT